MKRARWFLVILVAGSVAAAALSYRRWPRLLNRTTQQPLVASSPSPEIFSAPPFSTKEPERYQATRVITNVEAGQAPAVTRILVARDGDRRREEYDAGTEAALVHIETPTGQLVLLPARKLYADLNLAAANPATTGANVDADLSPEKLLHETRPEARYEKLGAEAVNGRAAMKYRVTIMDSTMEKAGGTKAVSETLIWIDDQLGMPIKSETTLLDGDRASKLTVELTDIKQDDNPALFELPKDYERVDYQRLRAEIERVVNAKKPN
jgi:outer membrane lipoprotein-sorting protein